MLVSKSKFYKEVTGSNTGNSLTTVQALKRWNIPFLDGNKKEDSVDIVHIPAAKEAYAKEQAERPTPQKQRVAQGELVQTVASRLAVLEDEFNRFRTTVIAWHEADTKRNIVAFKQPAKKKAR
jgi:hypothetical protein